MWALPGVHPANLELLQKLKSADTNHFTTHMDCVGDVSQWDSEENDWVKTHLVGIRTDVWRPDEEELKSAVNALQDQRRNELKKTANQSGRPAGKQARELQRQLADDKIMQMDSDDILSRRLVLKLFKVTGQRMRWSGTIEQITTSEVHNSIGSNRALLSFAVMLPRTQMVTHIQQNHRAFRIPPIFTFCFYDDGRMWHLMLRRRWLSVGADFDIQADGVTIGKIDGRLFCFGCDSYVNIDTHPLAEDTRFVDLLTLFACSVGYHKAMRRSIKRRVKAAAAGEWYRHIIEDEELRLRHNGRSAA
jgi:hypothetical protein